MLEFQQLYKGMHWVGIWRLEKTSTFCIAEAYMSGYMSGYEAICLLFCLHSIA
jgi:hypothetical protein